VSRNVCAHRGEKLPDNTTCGGLCTVFPECLPLPSPELLARLQEVFATGAREQLAHESLLSTLDQLRAAIDDGLERRGGACTP